MLRRESFIVFLLISAFISISVFEILTFLGLVFTLYEMYKEKRGTKGILSVPILTFSTVSFLSTLIFNFSYLLKGIEEGIFQLLYFFRVGKERLEKLKETILIVLILSGIFLYPVAVYTFLKNGESTLIWGSMFEAGHFFSIFSISSFLTGIYFYKKGNKKMSYIFLFLFVVFSTVVIFSFRRTAFLEFVVGTFLTAFVMYRSRFIGKNFFAGTFVFLLVFSVVDYSFMSLKDKRFKALNQILLNKEITAEKIDTVANMRYYIFLDAIDVIKTDLKEKSVLNILVGHGVRSGVNLPHKHSKEDMERYESFFILSEFIEKGLVGVLAVLFIFFRAFKFFVSLKPESLDKSIGLVFLIPLILHLTGVLFTYFWDALLPLYFLLFRVGEVYFEKETV